MVVTEQDHSVRPYLQDPTHYRAYTHRTYVRLYLEDIYTLSIDGLI